MGPVMVITTAEAFYSVLAVSVVSHLGGTVNANTGLKVVSSVVIVARVLQVGIP